MTLYISEASARRAAQSIACRGGTVRVTQAFVPNADGTADYGYIAKVLDARGQFVGVA